jgi:SHS2 domain-containing protein
VGQYAFLDAIAVADCALEIEGRSLDDLFETAARALAEVMVDPATMTATVARNLSLTAPSIDLLFYDWLSELIFLKDREELVFTDAVVQVREAGDYQLTARVTGGPIDRERTGLRADVKAVTFHQFAIEPTTRGWRARVVLDI